MNENIRILQEMTKNTRSIRHDAIRIVENLELEDAASDAITDDLAEIHRLQTVCAVVISRLREKITAIEAVQTA